MDTTPPQIPCPLCGAEVQVQLGIAPGVVWQAVRLQTARPGVIAFCAACESYFVFGPGSVSEGLQAAAGEQREKESPPGEGESQTGESRRGTSCHSAHELRLEESRHVRDEAGRGKAPAAGSGARNRPDEQREDGRRTQG